MKNTLWNELFNTPSAHQLVSRLIDGLASSNCQLVVVPDIVQIDAISNVIRAETSRRDFSAWEIDFRQNNVNVTLAGITQLLRKRLAADSPPDINFEDVVQDPKIPEVIFLEGVDALSDSSRRSLVQILSQWSRISRRAFEQDTHCATACCIAFGEMDMIGTALTEVNLNVEWWCGLPSALETALLCRYTIAGPWRNCEDVWRESLASSLCAGDISYVAAIWPSLLESRSSIWRCSREYAEGMGWDLRFLEEMLEKLPTNGRNDLAEKSGLACESLAPPRHLQPFWARGILHFSPDDGIEVHSAALALAGRIETLEQRVWRSQATLLLPKLDVIRHVICSRLASRFGPRWPIQWSQPISDEECDELRKSHYACQWGYMDHLLRTCPQLRAEHRLKPVVSLCRSIRNELAHYRPIEFSEFHTFWKHVTPFSRF